jgi:lysophospholipase L1-like esterase
MPFHAPRVSTRVLVCVVLSVLLASCATSPGGKVKAAPAAPAAPASPAEAVLPGASPVAASAISTTSGVSVTSVVPSTTAVAKPVQSAPAAPQLQRNAAMPWVQEGPAKPAFAWKTLADLIGAEKAQLMNTFVTPEVNTFEASNAQLLQRLKSKWEAAAQGRLTVLHFGDSHVQGGHAAQMVRHKWQSIVGSAGRGMVFPYAIAKTYSQNDYRSSFEGEWVTANSIQVNPKMPLGVSGFVARTSSPQAAFTLQFNQQFEPGAKVLKFFYRTSSAAYRLRMQSGDLLWESALPGEEGSQGGTQMVEIAVPQLFDTLRFEIANADVKPEDTFELYGVSIENKTPGVVYHNLGVGGAAYAALRSQAYFESQSKVLAPDLVILDWGTNDLIYKNTVPDQLEATIVETIRKVRAEHPDALIVLTTVQDTYFRKQPITATWEFAQMIRRLAKENDCLLYDWYRVAGGADAMRTWYAYGLAQPDHVHLSATGYAIKGDLLAQAMLNALNWQKNNPDKSSLWSDAQQAEVPRSVSAWLKALKPFQSRPDLIRVSAPGKGKGAAVAAKSANRKGEKATQAKSKASAKSAQSKTAKSAKSAKSTSAAKSKSNNAKKPQ